MNELKSKNLRSKRLISPRLQLHLIASFVGLALLAQLLQFLWLGRRLSRAVAELDGAGAHMAQELPAMLIGVLIFSIGLMLPVMLFFGTLLTFRIAGPVYRFEQYLAGIARGEETGPCKIRKGDELQGLCDAINVATEPLRAVVPPAEESADDAAPPEPQRRSA